MRVITNQALIIFFTALLVYIIYLLAPMLTPFLMGALLAYLSNPMVRKLTHWGIPHLLSVILVFLLVFGLIVLLFLMFIPIIEMQVKALMDVIPQMVLWTQETLLPLFSEYVDIETLKSSLTSAVPKTAWVFNTVIRSGSTLIDFLVNVVLTPVVMFYLLRDWEKLLKNVKAILPTSIRPTTIQLVKGCDEVLSAFFRGQLLVMLALCVIYGVGLTLVGLKVGLVIGLIGGLLSIVPYLGSAFVLIAATLTTLVQFGGAHALTWVLVVFLIGQSVEGYILTPYLIGERIGLHPVAVIFAVMAGGTLFGFFGVLVALPTAAVIMVLLRFARKQFIK